MAWSRVVAPPVAVRARSQIRRRMPPRAPTKTNIVERCSNRLKGFRGVATGYDKIATSYEAAGSLASFLLWAGSV